MPTAPLYDMTDVRDSRKAYLARQSTLMAERSTWDPHWLELARMLRPRAVKFNDERSRGGSQFYNRIYDNTALKAMRNVGAGMLAGISNPMQRWFNLVPSDPDLADYYPVRVYLDDVVTRMQARFNACNFYRVAHQVYVDKATFGTSCVIRRTHPTRRVHYMHVPIGRYCLAQDWAGDVDTLYRIVVKSVAETVREFGFSQCSEKLQQRWRNREFEGQVKILHVIEPRALEDRDPGNPFAHHKPWKSCYMEVDAEEDKMLRVSGFDRFPVLAPRWDTYDGDVYGHSPGMEILGDAIQLQQEQLMKGHGIAQQARPPLQVPSDMKEFESELFPSGIHYAESGAMLPYDQVQPNGGIRRAYEDSFRLDHLQGSIVDTRSRINSGSYADLFLMLANMGPDQRMTAREVAERHHEKLIALGPMLFRTHNEFLQPAIQEEFLAMQEEGALPPPPPELEEAELAVEFVSLLAMAQRAVGTDDIDRFMGNVVALQPVFPNIVDKVNSDRWVDRYSTMRGIPADLVNPDEVALKVRQERAKAEAARAQAEMMQQQAKAVRDLSQSPVGAGSALDLFPDAAQEQPTS